MCIESSVLLYLWLAYSLSLSPRHMDIKNNNTHTHTCEKICPPRPLAGLISGDWREHEVKSRWDVGPLADWVGEVSERT